MIHWKFPIVTAEISRMTYTTVLVFILAIYLRIQLSFGEAAGYSKDTNIKCQSRVDIGNYDNLKCAMMCMNYRAMTGLPCMAFNVSNSVCTLCLNGPVSYEKQVIWSSSEDVYAATINNFEEELTKGKNCDTINVYVLFHTSEI